MSNHVEITKNKINPSDVIELVSSPSSGATVMFLGTTRDNFDGKKVEKLEYECYESMAIKEIEKLCVDIRSKWEVINLGIVHRIGEVPIGEASVIIVVSSEHRAEAFLAAQYGIDTLKANVPIWKNEFYSEGPAQWKANKECFWSENS